MTRTPGAKHASQLRRVPVRQEARDIGKDEIHDYLAKPGCFVWVALKDATPEELAEMQQQFGLHELAVEDAHHGHQRPKLEEYGDSLYAVLHAIEPNGDEFRIGELNIFVGKNYVLSVRKIQRRVSPTCRPH